MPEQPQEARSAVQGQEWICPKCGDTAWLDHCSVCGAPKPDTPSVATCDCGHPQGWHRKNVGSCIECGCSRFAAAATDAEWERLVERLTAIGDGHLADRTITPWEARVLLGRIGALQVWALGALAREITRA